MTEYSDELITKAQKEGNGSDLLSYYLTRNEISPIEAKLMATDIFVAGVDTTSRLIQWVIHCIASTPRSLEVQALIRKEVIAAAGGVNEPITATALKKMPFLKACVKESLRLNPGKFFFNAVIFGMTRLLGKDLDLLGYKIPKGTEVLMSTYSMSKDPRNFTDPDLFNPERWLKRSGEKQSFSTLTFGHGARMCPGLVLFSSRS